jgi:hypothetical protein
MEGRHVGVAVIHDIKHAAMNRPPLADVPARAFNILKLSGHALA